MFSPRVKVCGITSVANALSARDAGVDAIGLVFYEPSPRNIVDLSLANHIAMSVGPFVNVLGLFVNPNTDFVEHVLSHVGLHVLQFHGEESPAFCESFGRPYIKALRMKPGLDVNQEMTRYSSACGILLDTYDPNLPGGTGKSFDWSRFPSMPEKPMVLAGGLNCDNIKSAVNSLKPYGVDVSGGVESAPGEKSNDLMVEFVCLAKSTESYSTPTV